jgi:ADP-ribosylglycohydrolase
MNNNQKYGLIYGLCVGDALGSRYEFLKKEEATELLEKDCKNHKICPILGEGFFNNEAGQITDDAGMALSLLNSLVKKKGYNRSNVARQYIKWFKSNPVDIGQTIRKALSTRKTARGKHDMINNSRELNSNSMSNGTLMRIAPISLLYPKFSKKEIKKIVYKECQLTHPSLIIADATWIYIYTIILITENKSKKEIHAELIKEAKTPKVYGVLLDCIKRPEPIIINDSIFDMTDSLKYQGYFAIALQNCLFEFFNGNSFEESLLNIIKRGGDVDTNCAIAGALLGSYYGVKKIPDLWIKTVKEYKGDRSKLYPTKNLEQKISQLHVSS